jgi:hypothetical protein
MIKDRTATLYNFSEGKVRMINKRTALALLTAYDECYRMGVFDAYEIDNAEFCKDHIGRTLEPGVFGRVTDDHTVGWREWSLMILYNLRASAYHTKTREFFMHMNPRTYPWVTCPVTQRFYNKGLEDYIESRNPSRIGAFRTKRKILWSGKDGKFTAWSRDLMIEDLQLLCYDIYRDNEPFRGLSKYAVTKVMCDNYARAVWGALMAMDDNWVI